MKKILILSGVLAIALTIGTAFAGNDVSAGEYNGITVFQLAPVTTHDLASGLTLENGITAFDIRPVAYSEGSAAGGLRTMEPSRELKNGITVF